MPMQTLLTLLGFCLLLCVLRLPPLLDPSCVLSRLLSSYPRCLLISNERRQDKSSPRPRPGLAIVSFTRRCYGNDRTRSWRKNGKWSTVVWLILPVTARAVRVANKGWGRTHAGSDRAIFPTHIHTQVRQLRSAAQ
jgi:hypothetical protein